MKLEIGAGDKPTPGFEHLDIRELPDIEYVIDATGPLPFPDNSIEEIRAKDVIEHFPRAKVRPALQEWCRVLVPGGSLELMAPNISSLAEGLVKGEIDLPFYELRLYGGQDYPENTHQNGSSVESITQLLKSVGFSTVKVVAVSNNYNLHVLGIK